MEHLLNQIIVVDVESPYVFVGKLTMVSEKTVTLKDVDVHDLRDSNTTRERYILDTRRDGVRVNRREVFVQQSHIVSMSSLADILD